MIKTAAITRPGLTWTEIGRFAEALTFARRALFTPVEEINADYTLGPSGIWVTGLIASGRIRSQSDLARRFGIPKSLVTEQIALLVSQDFVATAQAQDDKRQKTLSLTPVAARSTTGWARLSKPSSTSCSGIIQPRTCAAAPNSSLISPAQPKGARRLSRQATECYQTFMRSPGAR